MAAFTSFPANFTGEGQPEGVERVAMTINLFRLLGAQPLLGRLYHRIGRPGVAATLLLSYQLWQTRFGGDRVLGRTVRLDDVPFTGDRPDAARLLLPQSRHPTIDRLAELGARLGSGEPLLA